MSSTLSAAIASSCVFYPEFFAMPLPPAFLPNYGLSYGLIKPPLLLNSRRPRNLHTAHPPHPRRVFITCSVQDDHYQVLGLAEDADAQAVKRAYRRAALKNHPDVSDDPNARDRFLRVQEAYSVLSDAKRRAAYDRSRRGAASGFGGFGGFGTDADAAEFARRWRQGNPMPEDLNDNLGSIFSDLFSGVADAMNDGAAAGGGVVEDFIEFLERRVDGFSTGRRADGSKKSDVDGLEDVLRSRDEDVLRAEADDARFVIEQLQQRQRKAQAEEDSIRDRQRKWEERAKRADKQRDYDTRDAARDRASDLKDDARRFARRVDETKLHIRKQEDRLRRLEQRLKEVQSSPSRDETSDASESTRKANKSAQPQSSTNQKEAIDSELERMKRELGL